MLSVVKGKLPLTHVMGTGMLNIFCVMRHNQLI